VRLSTIAIVARSRESVWLALAGGFIGVGGAFMGVAAGFDAASKVPYSLWTSVPMAVAYAMFGLSLGCFACGTGEVPIPFPTGSRAVDQPAPALMEVVRQAGGRLEDQNAVQWLTRFRLSRELWGDPDPDFFNFLRRRRTVAGQLAGSDHQVREHLDAALSLVPDYSRDLDPYGLPERNAVGILAVTITLLVKVRNLGAESGGVTLRSSTERVLRPPGLQSLDARVEYRVSTDETRHVVAPGAPADIPLTVWMGCARNAHSNVPVDTSHAIAVARVARAFADFLCGPIEGVEVDAVLDGGRQLQAALEIRIQDAADRCALRELDVAELERHAMALDEAVDRRTQEEIRQSQGGNPGPGTPPGDG
jgi:hypothetical protein